MRRLITLGFGILCSMATLAQTSTIKTPKPEGYVINGNITGDYKGMVYLVKEKFLKGPQTRLDSCEVVNGKYSFKGKVEGDPVIHFISNSGGSLTPLFLENGTININASADNFYHGQVSGTVNNDIFKFYNFQTRYITDSIISATVIDWSRFGREDMDKESEAFQERTKLTKKRSLDIQRQMAMRYNTEAFAPFIILFEMISDCTLDELKELRASLDPSLDAHPYTIQLEEYMANADFKIGMVAPDFSIKGMDGKMINLKDYRGKYVLIDFWASWCGPCLKEMPNVVKLYSETKRDKFEILGISIDSKDKEAAWKKSIKDHNMKWIQACDFETWFGPVARKYDVQAIPRTILVDPDGNVAGIDLRGEELMKTVKKLTK